MRTLITLLSILFLSPMAHGYVYGLSCQASDNDAFSVNIDTKNNRLYFTETSDFSINVDDYYYDANISEKAVFVDADISTYDYFLGDVKFYLGQGLYKTQHNQKIKIALDADDGDGYGFDKKTFSCRVHHNVELQTWDETFECFDQEFNEIYTVQINEELERTVVTLDTGAAPFQLNSPNLDYDLDEDGDKTAYIISWAETVLSLGSGIQPAQTMVINAEPANGHSGYREAKIGDRKLICARK
ncbi:MAG: hypothetical protein HRT44_01900 [Bdellovibrionales bacterium]|nr:hypothetical protein [Bdellovibrionales bacterium]NQZ18000.1 hypothetical protein [Bdellovibrionales bacterium]